MTPTREELLAIGEKAGGKLLDGVALYVGRYHISTQFLERFASLLLDRYAKDAERYRWLSAEAAESRNKRMVELLQEPSEAMQEKVLEAICTTGIFSDKDFAELLKEVGE